MISVLNRKLMHLAAGQEGYAVALTIVVWPMMLLMISGVYVTGETVRRKILMQMTADNAAVAGAVVQADMLGRMAVVNRMMAWTYLQAGKREMDYVVGEWITNVRNTMATAGATTAHINSETGNVNTLAQLNTGLDGYDSADMKAALDSAYLNIQAMNECLADMVSNGKSRIQNAVVSSIAANTTDLSASQSSWIQINDLADYVDAVSTEEAFLNFTSGGYSAMQSQTGFDVWWRQLSGNTKFRRDYETTGNTLKAWVENPGFGTSTKVEATNAYAEATGSKKVSAQPKALTSAFTAKGAVTVALKHPLKNPLEIICSSLDGSWFDAYTVEGTDMWCIGAARACMYDSTQTGYSLSKYDENSTDWEAALISLAKASETGLASDLIKSAYTALGVSGWADLDDWTILDAKAVH